MLKRFEYLNVVGQANHLAEARLMLDATDPDLIFLDVEMGLEIGFSLIDQTDQAPMVIIVSASEAYAIKAFELRALDYLVKPFTLDRLKESLSRLRLCCVGGTRSPRCRAVSALLRADDVALISDGDIHAMILVRAILYIQANGNYTEVYMEDESRHLVRRTCEEWLRLLPEECFAQLDRSCIVNLHQVQAWRTDGREMCLALGTNARELRIGRAAAERFKERIARDLPC
jgi:two-component system LytT family response regulator